MKSEQLERQSFEHFWKEFNCKGKGRSGTVASGRIWSREFCFSVRVNNNILTYWWWRSSREEKVDEARERGKIIHIYKESMRGWDIAHKDTV